MKNKLFKLKYNNFNHIDYWSYNTSKLNYIWHSNSLKYKHRMLNEEIYGIRLNYFNYKK